MGKPWAELTSAERLDAILLAVAEIQTGQHGLGEDATANTIAYVVNRQHRMARPRSGNHGTGNVARQMALATRVTPGITALRRRGWLRLCGRTDGWSGSADRLTEEGRLRVHELRTKQS